VKKWGRLYKITLHYEIPASNPIFSVHVSCCTKFLAVQNPTLGRILTIDTVLPLYIGTGIWPKKQLLDFVEAVGFVQLKLSETMQKKTKNKKNTSNYVKTVQ
jgi:hypothetical protein